MNNHQPDFFSIGPSKTGTSWLLHHLYCHPQVQYPIIKDLNFFDEADLSTFIRKKHHIERENEEYGNYFDMYNGNNLSNFEYVLQLRKAQQKTNFRSVVNFKNFSRMNFKQLLYGMRFKLLTRDLDRGSIEKYGRWLFNKQNGKIAGDLSTQYFKLSSTTIGIIARSFPKLKIIIGIRNPVDRRWSYLRMKHHMTDDIVNSVVVDAETASLPDLDGDYKSAITNWTKHFPKEQIHYAFFDELTQDPSTYLKNIYNFLDIRFSEDMVDPQFRNKGKESLPTKEIKEILFEVSKKQFAFLRAYFPDNKYIQDWVLD